MLNRHRLLVPGVVAFVVSIMVLTGCGTLSRFFGGETPPAEPRVEAVQLCSSLLSDQSCAEPASTFDSSDTIFCSVQVKDIAAGNSVEARWLRDDTQVADYTLQIDQSGSGFLGFSLAPDPFLPAGAYRVEIYLNDALVLSSDFRVEGEAVAAVTETPLAEPTATSTPQPQQTPTRPPKPVVSMPTLAPTAPSGDGIWISGVTFASGVTDDDRPVGIASSFPEGTTEVFGFFDYAGIPANSTWYWVWLHEDEQFHLSDEYAWEGGSEGDWWVGITVDEGLVEGIYTLELYVNDQLVQWGEFQVGSGAGRSPTTGEAEWVIGDIVFAAGVSDADTPIGISETFAAGTKTVYGFFEYWGMYDGLEWFWVWYLDGEPYSASDYYVWNGGEQGDWWVSVTFDQGFEAGIWLLGIFVEDELVGLGGFEVTAGAAAITPTTTTAPQAAVPRGKLAYTLHTGSQYQIWSINLDGTGQRLLADLASEPSWSPDGRWMVFYGWEGRQGGNGIWAMNADGSNQRALLNDGNASFINLSADGRFVLFFTQRGMSGLRLFVYDLQAGTERDISGGEEPAWAPDGKRIVYKGCIGGDCGLIVAGADGSNPRRISSLKNSGNPSWSPDGRRIAFISDESGNWEIYTINPDGSGLARLTNHQDIDAHPVWTPDSKFIVFRSTRGGKWGIWIMNADGSNPRKIIDAQVSNDWWFDRMSITR